MRKEKIEYDFLKMKAVWKTKKKVKEGLNIIFAKKNQKKQHLIKKLYLCRELIINFYNKKKMKKLALSLVLVASVAFVSCKDTNKEAATEVEQTATEAVEAVEDTANEAIDATEEAANEAIDAVEETAVEAEAAVEEAVN